MDNDRPFVLQSAPRTAVPRDRVRAFAPASIGNVAVGFDRFGLAIEGPGDTVTVRRRARRGVSIAAIRGCCTTLPIDAAHNTAGRALEALSEATRPDHGFEIEIDKGIALGSGMGGSAASAVAALIAANALLDRPLTRAELYPFAVEGEFVASGGRHGDNVAPQLLGGLVFVGDGGRLMRLPTPAEVLSVVVHPHFVLETRRARSVLALPHPIAKFVAQSGHLVDFVMGLVNGDLELVRRGLVDELVEPRRAGLVPGFRTVKRAALESGALGASLSGAGPSLFALCVGAPSAAAVGAAMQEAFADAGLASDVYVSRLDAPGARLLED